MGGGAAQNPAFFFCLFGMSAKQSVGCSVSLLVRYMNYQGTALRWKESINVAKDSEPLLCMAHLFWLQILVVVPAFSALQKKSKISMASLPSDMCSSLGTARGCVGATIPASEGPCMLLSSSMRRLLGRYHWLPNENDPPQEAKHVSYSGGWAMLSQ